MVDMYYGVSRASFRGDLLGRPVYLIRMIRIRKAYRLSIKIILTCDRLVKLDIIYTIL